MYDLTGERFGRWYVIKRVKNSKPPKWLCQCSCENKTIRAVNGASLRTGQSKSCGCLQKECLEQIRKQSFTDLTGQKFGRLTVIKKGPSYKDNRGTTRFKWECLCDCGTTTFVTSNLLTSGKTQSCGCLRSKGEEKISELLTKANIPFEKEKTFESCINPKTNAKLRFDFYVNNQYLIEYDGEQHFSTSKSGWNTQEHFQKTKEQDQIKNLWCKNNNIPLIRIPYTKLATLTIEDLKITNI